MAKLCCVLLLWLSVVTGAEVTSPLQLQACFRETMMKRLQVQAYFHESMMRRRVVVRFLCALFDTQGGAGAAMLALRVGAVERVWLGAMLEPVITADVQNLTRQLHRLAASVQQPAEGAAAAQPTSVLLPAIKHLSPDLLTRCRATPQK